MKLRNIFYPVLIACFACCNTEIKKQQPILPSNSVLGTWKLADIALADSARFNTDDKMLREAMLKKEVQEGIMVCFFADGTFTTMNGAGLFRTEKWKYADNGRAIEINDSGRIRTNFIAHSVNNGRQMMEMLMPSVKGKAKFVLYTDSLSNFHEDPFYAENNLWRTPPKEPETMEELQNRLGNYFKHLLYILKEAKDRNQQEISFQYSRGIVKIYNGGIGIVDENSVPYSWARTYYNPVQAHAVYLMFRNYLHSTSYHGAGTGQWVEDDYNILLSIYGDLKTGKFNNKNAGN